jgi:hypothetical protein
MSRPHMYISRAVSEGFAILGAAHASLAWRLRASEDPAPPALIQYDPGDFEWVDASRLEGLKQSGTHLVITESTLGHSESILVVGSPDVVLAPLPERVAAQERGESVVQKPLKMYILLLEHLPLPHALAASATAAVQCYDAFVADPVMQAWVSGRFAKSVCAVNERELASAQDTPGHCVVRIGDSGQVVGAAFCPRPQWPAHFGFYRIFRKTQPGWA